MSYLTKTIDQDPFRRFIVVSMFAHIGLLLFFTVKTAFFPTEDIILRSAMRVDIVGLPDKITKPKPVAKKKQPKKVKIKNKAKTKKDQKRALEKLSALTALNKIKKDVEGKKEKEDESQENPMLEKPKEFKGNIISSGDSFSGLDRLEFDGYYTKLKQHLSTHWNLPQWLADANLKAQVLIYLDERGYVTRKEILLSSSNVIFDEKALEAVSQASPFPEPPLRLRGALSGNGLVFNFPEE